MLIYIFILSLPISISALELKDNAKACHFPINKSITEKFIDKLTAAKSIIDIQNIIKSIDEYRTIKIYNNELILIANQKKLSQALKAKLEELGIPYDLCAAIKNSQSLFIIDLLIRAGALLEKHDDQEYNPLILAAQTENIRIVSLLLHAGADVHAIDPSSKKNCIEIAKEKKNEELVTLIKQHTNKMISLYSNIRTNNLKEIIRFIKKGGNINTIYAGQHPLYIAAFNDNVNLVKLMIKHGADIETSNCYGRYPLHAATLNNSIKSAKALLIAGASVLQKDTFGNTPLDIALEKNNLEMLYLLNEYLPNQENSSKNN